MVNANRHDYIFSFAHEIGHILNDDTGISPLFYSGTNRSKDEAAANRTAINLLLPYYCSEKINMWLMRKSLLCYSKHLNICII